MVLVGTSGWSYPSGRGTWNGVFYPAPRPRGFDELAFYADHFDTVEVNSSFYRMPDAGLTQKWVDRTPASFSFAVKLFQKFTHPEMYQARHGVKEWDLSRDDIDLFRSGLEPLASQARLAALLIQFPPSFHRTTESRAYLEWLLAAFRAYPLAIELRHKTWSDEGADTTSILNQFDASWVLIDEPKFASSVRQRDVPTSSSSLLYMRLHGRNAAEWWQHAASEDRYNYLYSPEELQPFAKQADTASKAGRRVLVYMNNHFSAKAVANAAVLKHELGQPVPGEYTAEMLEKYPQLVSAVSTNGRLR